MVVKGGSSSFLEPRVVRSRVANEVVQTWVTKSRTLKEWNVLFAHANSTESADDDDNISEEEVMSFKPVTHADISAKEEFAAQLSEPAYLAFSPNKKQLREEEDITMLSHEDLLVRVVQVTKVMDNGLSDTSDLVVQFMTSFEESNHQMLGKGLKAIEYHAQASKNEFGAPPSTLSPESPIEFSEERTKFYVAPVFSDGNTMGVGS
eukprot:scaffold143881_cov62-Attheya_sp.AAC.1